MMKNKHRKPICLDKKKQQKEDDITLNQIVELAKKKMAQKTNN